MSDNRRVYRTIQQAILLLLALCARTALPAGSDPRVGVHRRWQRGRARLHHLKSHGFHLQKSHLANTQRLGTLMIAACLAYLWIVYLGLTAIRTNRVRSIHRADRCDWSLFRLGLALFDYLLNEKFPIPVSFALMEPKSVP